MGAGVSDATQRFFDDLAERGHEPLLGTARGTLRFDLESDARTEHWRVAIRKGNVTVSRGDEAADAVVSARRELFDQLATGEANATAALLRGQIALTGEYDLMVHFQRVFPSPPA
jgi:putative sterol carrier protein